MCHAYFCVLPSKIHRARILQILAERLACKTVIEEVLTLFNRFNVRPPSHRASILRCNLFYILDSRSLESVRNNGVFSSELYNSKFNRKTWILRIHQE